MTTTKIDNLATAGFVIDEDLDHIEGDRKKDSRLARAAYLMTVTNFRHPHYMTTKSIIRTFEDFPFCLPVLKEKLKNLAVSTPSLEYIAEFSFWVEKDFVERIYLYPSQYAYALNNNNPNLGRELRNAVRILYSDK